MQANDSPEHALNLNASSARWTSEQARKWYQQQPWLAGCNFTPSTAINQIEMWQAETFDLRTIDRELGWAAGIGFKTVRVFLHDLVSQADADGFQQRIDQYIDGGEEPGSARRSSSSTTAGTKTPRPAGSLSRALVCIIPAGCKVPDAALSLGLIGHGWSATY